MNAGTCEQLESYLLRDLDAEGQTRFEEHLRTCVACRLEIEEQARINQLLKTAAETMPIPNAMAARKQPSLPYHREVARSSWGSLVPALLVVGLIGLAVLGHRSSDKVRDQENATDKQSTKSNTNQIANNATQSPRADVNRRVKVEVPDDVLSLPIDTGEPDITLIQLFPVSNVSRGR